MVLQVDDVTGVVVSQILLDTALPGLRSFPFLTSWRHHSKEQRPGELSIPKASIAFGGRMLLAVLMPVAEPRAGVMVQPQEQRCTPGPMRLCHSTHVQ